MQSFHDKNNKKIVRAKINFGFDKFFYELSKIEIFQNVNKLI